MIILDTHAWIWWLSNPEMLSDVARRTIDDATARSAVGVSAMSVWELMTLTKKGRLQLSIDPAEWIALAEGLPAFRILPVTSAIAVKSVTLPDIHSDPADRIIIATALVENLYLVSKDEKIGKYPGVKVMW